MPRKKRRIAVIDCETDPFLRHREPKPFVWGYYDGEIYEEFWGDPLDPYLGWESCTRDLVEFITDLSYEVTIYAHNGGKFDYFFLLAYLEREKITVINGRLSTCHIGKCVLKDSFNIIPVPLAVYKKDEFEYWKMEEPVRDKYRNEISNYLYGDCTYLFELVEAFISKFGGKLTAASAAMTELRKTVEEESGYPFDKMNAFTDGKYRPYYYGGRCQAFKTGEIKERIKIFDINSAYPTAMKQKHPDPTFLSFTITDKIPRKTDCYFATIKAVSRGALPYRDPELHRLSFPDDNIVREYMVTGWEIAAGRRTGTLDVKEVLEVRIPDRVRDFSTYVDKWYVEKKEGKANGDKVKELFAKIMLNSPYGKFAINPDEFKEYKIVDYGEFPDDNPDSEDGHGEWEIYSTWPEHDIDMYMRPSPKPFGYINVAVAASITGWVRAYLWESICKSKGVVYCDTDSIFCEESDVKLSKELGDWEHEGTSTETYIAGRKNYAMYKGNLCVRRWAYTEHDNINMDKEVNVRYAIDDIKKAKSLGWKLASKGSRLLPHELAHIATTDEIVEWFNDVPTYSIKHGTRFLQRKIKKIV